MSVFPWPTRRERKGRVEAARKGAEQARGKVAESDKLKRDLQEILQRNHFAQIIVEGLMQQHGEQGQ